MWRTLIGIHDSVVYSLMEAGHTKFNPDLHFRFCKVKWRHTCTSVETLQEMAESVTRSYKNGHNIPQLVDEKHVVFYDWASLLKKMFKPITQLKSYHHFRYLQNVNVKVLLHLI